MSFAACSRHVDGDYNDPATYQAIRRELGSAERPAHYLAIPPLLFAAVVEQLAKSCYTSGRIIVEKPFGHDLPSAKNLNRILHSYFRREGHLPHRPLPRQNAGAQHAFPSIRQPVLEPFWNRIHVESVQITMANTSESKAVVPSTIKPVRSATWSRTICSRSWPT